MFPADHILHGWPNRHTVKEGHLHYSPVRDKLALNDDLLLYGNRITVPKIMQAESLQKIHQVHQGIQRCCLRVAWLFDGQDCPERSKVLLKHVLPIRRTPFLLNSQCCRVPKPSFLSNLDTEIHMDGHLNGELPYPNGLCYLNGELHYPNVNAVIWMQWCS